MTYQTTFWHKPIDESKLGSYVYALIDPNGEEVFYIGLAGGLDDQGNSRPNCHLLETSRALNDKKELTQKQQRIKSIWDRGQNVSLKIIRRKLEREVAKHVEAALIDLLRKSKFSGYLTNAIKGHGSEHSLIDESNVATIFREKPNCQINNLWLFNIDKAVTKEKKRCFDAVIGDWSISSKHLEGLNTCPQYAVGLIQGISRVVIKIDAVEIAPNTRNKKRFKATEINSEEIGVQLYEKDFGWIVNQTNYWKRNGGRLRVNLNLENYEITWGQQNEVLIP